MEAPSVNSFKNRMVKGFKKLPYETKLKKLGIYSLDRRRLRRDLFIIYYWIVHKVQEKQHTYIKTGKEHVNSSKFFQPSEITSGLRGHSLKLFKPRCRTTTRHNFFRYVSSVNGTSYLKKSWMHRPSINPFKNRLDRHWIDMGVFSRMALQPINIKYQVSISIRMDTCRYRQLKSWCLQSPSTTSNKYISTNNFKKYLERLWLSRYFERWSLWCL